MQRFVLKRIIIYCLAGVVLAACNEAYVRPETPVPATWSKVVTLTDGGRAADKIDWRTFFSDERLQALIETALDHNRDMRIAVARVEEARAQHGISRADQMPNVNLVGSFNQALTPGGLGGSNQSVTGKRHDVTLSSISYEVDFWSRLSGLEESARASYLASEEAQRTMRLSLISDVANAYYSLLESEERVELTRSILAVREKTRMLISRARNAGYASAIDYLQADSTVESALTELSMRERERAAAVNWLQFLVGRMPDILPPGKALATQDNNVDLAVGLPSDILVTRPDVLAAEQRLKAANANIGAVRAAFLPKILLTGLYGTASRALVGLFSAGTNSWVFQPTITMPLFDGGRNASNLDAAEARKNIAVAEYEKTIQQAFREVADLLATRASLVEQLRSAEANLRIQEERLRVTQNLFKGGMISNLNVLDAERELFSAQQTIVQVRRSQLGTAAQLYKALGGGLG